MTGIIALLINLLILALIVVIVPWVILCAVIWFGAAWVLGQLLDAIGW